MARRRNVRVRLCKGWLFDLRGRQWEINICREDQQGPKWMPRPWSSATPKLHGREVSLKQISLHLVSYRGLYLSFDWFITEESENTQNPAITTKGSKHCNSLVVKIKRMLSRSQAMAYVQPDLWSLLPEDGILFVCVFVMCGLLWICIRSLPYCIVSWDLPGG